MKKNKQKQSLKKISFKLQGSKKNILEHQYTLEYFRKLLLRKFSTIFMLFFLIAASFTANMMYDYLYSLDSKNPESVEIAEDTNDKATVKKEESQEFDFEKFKDVIIEIEKRSELFVLDAEDSKDIFK